MVKALLDTNVLIDVLIDRAEWLPAGQALFGAAKAGVFRGYASATTLTDVYYICRKLVGHDSARLGVRACLDHLTVIPVAHALLEEAWALPIKDFEDAVQIACAVEAAVDAIVTRDIRGFVASPIAVYSPLDFLARIGVPVDPPTDPTYAD